MWLVLRGRLWGAQTLPIIMHVPYPMPINSFYPPDTSDSLLPKLSCGAIFSVFSCTFILFPWVLKCLNSISVCVFVHLLVTAILIFVINWPIVTLVFWICSRLTSASSHMEVWMLAVLWHLPEEPPTRTRRSELLHRCGLLLLVAYHAPPLVRTTPSLR